MKANLSKEHIEKGCKLITHVDEFEFTYNHSVVQGFTYDNAYQYNYIKSVDDVRYIAFLQLVIEAINRKWRKNEEMGWCIDQNGWFVETSFNSKSHETYYLEDMDEIEAKEKAIAYVFDNMEREA